MDLPEYLSDDQKDALEIVLESVENVRETVLVGPAGSGKSTLTQEILNLTPRSAVLGAPTGKAALVLKEKSGREANTIHSLLYGSAEFNRQTKKLTFGRPGAPCRQDDLLIIDEGSMVGSKLYKELMSWVPEGARVLWIGDKEQLPPVNDTWGPNLDRATAMLTKVHRQAERSQIIRYATAIREGRGDKWQNHEYDANDPNFQVWDGIESAVDWLIDARERNEDATLLTYTHRIRQAVNERVRYKLGLDKEKFSPGDKLVVRSNNHEIGLMNGEVVTVKDALLLGKFVTADGEVQRWSIELEETPYPLFICEEHLEKDASIFQLWKKDSGLTKDETGQYLHVHYGQCLTVHSSQGSQWKKSGFIWDSKYNQMKAEDPDSARRFLYTAVTRAAETLAIFMA